MKITKRINSLIVLFCLLVNLAGCGYTTRSLLHSQYKTIYITQFNNKIDITKDGDSFTTHKIYRPMLETDITKSTINRYLFDGNLRPSKNESADLVLKGDLVEFRRDAVRYNNSDDVEEYRISISVDISLWDKKEDKLIWQEKHFTGDSTYFTVGINAKSEATAVNDALNDLSRRIVERTVEQW